MIVIYESACNQQKHWFRQAYRYPATGPAQPREIAAQRQAPPGVTGIPLLGKIKRLEDMFPFGHRTCAFRHLDDGCRRCGDSGLIAGTLVNTSFGPARVSELRRGQKLPVFPRGNQPLRGVSSQTIWLDPVDCPATARPICLPAGALGNDRAVLLQPNTRILFRDGALAARMGSPWLTLRADDLTGFRGIAREPAPPKRAALYALDFDDDEFVSIENGLRVFCEVATDPVDRLITRHGAREDFGRARVAHLGHEQAEAYVASLEAEFSDPASAWPAGMTTAKTVT